MCPTGGRAFFPKKRKLREESVKLQYADLKVIPLPFVSIPSPLSTHPYVLDHIPLAIRPCPYPRTHVISPLPVLPYVLDHIIVYTFKFILEML